MFKYKYKTIFIVFIILLAFLTVSVIYAVENVRFGKSSFSIPEGYTFMEKDNQLVIYNEDYVISIYEGSIIDPAKAKDARIKKGYNFTGEKNYTIDSTEVNQQNFDNSGYNCLYYTFNKNNKNYIIGLVIEDNKPIPTDEVNPVIGIIHSLT